MSVPNKRSLIESIKAITITKSQCVSTQIVNWTRQVFNVNQYMFAIWQFLEFPACLPLASVHSTWQQRLWPHRTIPISLLFEPAVDFIQLRRQDPYAYQNCLEKQYQQLLCITAKYPLARPIQSSCPPCSITHFKASPLSQLNHVILRTLPAHPALPFVSCLTDHYHSFHTSTQ